MNNLRIVCPCSFNKIKELILSLIIKQIVHKHQNKFMNKFMRMKLALYI